MANQKISINKKQNPQQYSCKKCKKSYDLQGTILNHVKNKHNDDKTLILNRFSKKVGRPLKNKTLAAKSQQSIIPYEPVSILKPELNLEIPIDLKGFISSYYYGKIICQIILIQREDYIFPQQFEKNAMNILKKQVKEYCDQLQLNEYEQKQYFHMLQIMKNCIWPHIKEEEILQFSKEIILAFLSIQCNSQDEISYIQSQAENSQRYLDLSSSFRKNNQNILNEQIESNQMNEDDMKEDFSETGTSYQNVESKKMEDMQTIQQQQFQQYQQQDQQIMQHEQQNQQEQQQQQIHQIQSPIFQVSENEGQLQFENVLSFQIYEEFDAESQIQMQQNQKLIHHQTFSQSTQQNEMNEQILSCSQSFQNYQDESCLMKNQEYLENLQLNNQEFLENLQNDNQVYFQNTLNNNQEYLQNPEFNNIKISQQQNEFQQYQSYQSQDNAYQINNQHEIKYKSYSINNHLSQININYFENNNTLYKYNQCIIQK